MQLSRSSFLKIRLATRGRAIHLAHRDLASRIHVCNAPEADKSEPTRKTHSGHSTTLRSPSRIDTLWNIGAVHSGLIPANLITLAHFSVSSAMSFRKSEGEPARVMPPISARRALILGSARPASISLLSLSMISVGVPAGAPIPYHELAS